MNFLPKAVLAAAAAMALASPAGAQDVRLPKTIRIVVPFSPGGSNDLFARALRASCEPPPGVQAVLDNEDAISTTLQPVAALPEMLAAGERPPAPVANPDAYGGPAFTVMTAQAAK